MFACTVGMAIPDSVAVEATTSSFALFIADALVVIPPKESVALLPPLLSFAFQLPAARVLRCENSRKCGPSAPPIFIHGECEMSKAAAITDMRIRVLRTLRRTARTHRKQEAHLLAQGAEDMRACLEDREARDTAAIEAARMAIKSAHVGRLESEWAARRAHTAANSPTQCPERAAPL